MKTEVLMETIEDLKEFIKQLPEESRREYELAITKLVTQKQNPEFTYWLKQLMENEDETIAYDAFVCLNIYYRRDHDYTQLELLINSQRSRFQHHISFSHIELLSLIGNARKEPTMANLIQGHQNISKMPSNAGILHIFADLTATYYELKDTYQNTKTEVIENGEAENMQKQEWLSKAFYAVEEAIQLQNYAKFFCTRGRILALMGNFDEAMESIKDAIDFEDSSERDYAIRIGNYQYHKLSILARMQNQQIKNLVEHYEKRIKQENQKVQQELMDTTKKIENSTIKNLEFLGLFAGIIGFTIGSISIAGNLAGKSFAGAAGLIIVLMGALLCVFSGFGVILHGLEKGKRGRNIVVFLAGLTVMAGGLLLCFNL
jgi:tetratricopeptide (TPR) repeat protein